MVLIFTYPLVIYPTNQILEKLAIDKLFKPNSSIGYWLKNCSRLAVCFLSTYSAIELSKSLDKFIGLLGAVLCAPLALIIPTICHFKLVAQTRTEKIIDIVIVAFSFIIMVFCVVQTLEGFYK